MRTEHAPEYTRCYADTRVNNRPFLQVHFPELTGERLQSYTVIGVSAIVLYNTHATLGMKLI